MSALISGGPVPLSLPKQNPKCLLHHARHFGGVSTRVMEYYQTKINFPSLEVGSSPRTKALLCFCVVVY